MADGSSQRHSSAATGAFSILGIHSLLLYLSYLTSKISIQGCSLVYFDVLRHRYLGASPPTPKPPECCTNARPYRTVLFCQPARYRKNDGVQRCFAFGAQSSSTKGTTAPTAVRTMDDRGNLKSSHMHTIHTRRYSTTRQQY